MVDGISFKLRNVDEAVREIETKGWGFNFQLRGCPEKAMRDSIETDLNKLVPQLVQKYGGQMTIEAASAGGNGGNVTLDAPAGAKTVGEQVSEGFEKAKKESKGAKPSKKLAKGKRNRERERD